MFVKEVTEGSWGDADAGVKAGDEIVKLNGK